MKLRQPDFALSKQFRQGANSSPAVAGKDERRTKFCSLLNGLAYAALDKK